MDNKINYKIANVGTLAAQHRNPLSTVRNAPLGESIGRFSITLLAMSKVRLIGAPYPDCVPR